MSSRLGLLTLAAVAMGGMGGFDAPFPGAVRVERDKNKDLETCVKLYPEVIRIQRKQSRLSASERRRVMHAWDSASINLDEKQIAQLTEIITRETSQP